MLKEIASSGGGSYIRANNSKAGLDALFTEINKMEKKKLAQWFLQILRIDFKFLLQLHLFF